MKISVCGLGVMGKNHIRVSKKLGFEIISSYDIMDTTDYKDFLSSLSKSDCLIIATPTKEHTRIIIDAKQKNKNIKILCEKPISDLSEDPLLSEILKYEDSVLVGQIERFNPVVAKVKENIEINNANIIQIKTKRVNNVPSREKIHCKKDIGIHDLDFCCYLVKGYPDKIDVMSTNNFYHENLNYKIFDVQINNEVSWLYPYKDRTFEILTDEGIFFGHFYRQELKFIDWSAKETNFEIQKVEPLVNEQLHLLEMVKNDKMPLVTVSENIKLLKLMGY